MEARKRIALVAHDARKAELIHWVESNSGALKDHQLWATGTTGKKIQEACPMLDVTPLKSGPLGGDQQIGAKIAEGGLDMLIFFTDARALPEKVGTGFSAGKCSRHRSGAFLIRQGDSALSGKALGCGDILGIPNWDWF
jgi:hypothetical protein